MPSAEPTTFHGISFSAPSLKAAVGGRVQAMDYRQILPAAPPSRCHMLDGTRHSPVVNTRNAARGRKERIEKRDLPIRHRYRMVIGIVFRFALAEIDSVVHRVFNGMVHVTGNVAAYVMAPCLASMKRVYKARESHLHRQLKGTLRRSAARKAILQEWQKAAEQHRCKAGIIADVSLRNLMRTDPSQPVGKWL